MQKRREMVEKERKKERKEEKKATGVDEATSGGRGGEQRSDVGLTDSLPFVQTNQNGLRINMRLRAKANARMLGHDPSMYEGGPRGWEEGESRSASGRSTSGI